MLRGLAADLPHMGELWPSSWLKATEALARRPEEHLSPGAVRKELASHGVTDGTAVTSDDVIASLRRWAVRDGAGQHMMQRVADIVRKDDKPTLVMDTTKDALKQARGFKYDKTATTWKPDAKSDTK